VVGLDDLTRLVALSPGDGRTAALVRRVFSETLSLPPLPIAAALGGDAPRVEHGTERYLLDADGHTVFS